MRKHKKRQYTLRNIPVAVDAALRQRALAEDKSLNDVAVDALARAMGVADEPVRYRDLSDLAGRWLEDPKFDAAMGDQDVIDEALWR